jgi:hypothetical protein
LTVAEVLIILARCANFRVERVSCKKFWQLLTVAIMLVRELPLKESRKKNVSLLSRYGAWLFRLLSLRVFITIPRVLNDLLMSLAYLSRYPVD